MPELHEMWPTAIVIIIAIERSLNVKSTILGIFKTVNESYHIWD